jgi:uncharacterized protein (TIGR03067 family)
MSKNAFVARGIVTSLLLAPALLVAAVPKDEESRTQTRYQPSLFGTWQWVGFVSDGQARTDDDFPDMQRLSLCIRKSGIWFNNRLGYRLPQKMYKADTWEDPARIDFPDSDKDRESNHLYGQGIYRIEGDTLKICLAEQRPDSFTARQGSGRRLYTFRLIKR